MIRGTSVGVPRSDLAGLMIQRSTTMDHFVALSLFPALMTQIVSSRFYKLAKARAHKKYATLKQPSAAASRSQGELESDTFTCEQYMHDEAVDRGEAAIFGDFFAADKIAAENVLFILLRDLEAAVLDQLINNTNFPLSGNTGLTVSNVWNGASGTPITDVNTGREAFRARGAMEPNLLVISEKCYDGLGSNPEIIGRIKYVSNAVENGRLTIQALQAAFDIERVVVARSRVNTANDGITASLSPQLAVGDAFLARVSNEQNTREWQLGRTFFYTGKTGGMFGARMYPSDEIDADMVRGEAWWNAKLMNTDCGFRLASVAS